MEAIAAEGAKVLFGYGVLGVFTVLGWLVALLLYRENQTDDTARVAALKEAYALLAASQEKRIEEAGRLSTVIERVNGTLATLAASVDTRTVVIAELERTVADLGRTIADETARSRDALYETRRVLESMRGRP